MDDLCQENSVDERAAKKVIVRYRRQALAVFLWNMSLCIFVFYLWGGRITYALLSFLGYMVVILGGVYYRKLIYLEKLEKAKKENPTLLDPNTEQRVQDIWNKHCAAHGLSSGGVYVLPEGIEPDGLTTAAVFNAAFIATRPILVVNTNLAKQISDNELAALVEHEIAHIRRPGAMVRLSVIFSAIPTTILLRFCRAIRAQLGWDPLANPFTCAAYCGELLLFEFSTYGIWQREEYASDASAALMEGSSRHVISLLLATEKYVADQDSISVLMEFLEEKDTGEHVFTNHPPPARRIAALERLEQKITP